MQKRTLKVALLAVLTVVLVLGTSTVALADQTWTDLPDYVTAKYGVDDNQVAAISEGYPGGLWKPFQSVTRAQFTKMAVAAFNIPLVNPAVASYTDVPKTDMYYQYIEGAKAAGVVNGTSATTFSPKANITRQQALAIVARYVADANGYDLATMYTAAEIDALLAHFGDAANISADLKDEMAFAFDFGLTVGNDYGNLDPLANLTRIQGAVLLIRAQAKVPPAQWTAAKVEITTADKAENLIGQVHPVTIKVTTADGHPAKQVLVDIDTLTGSDYYVGNISPQAAVTDSMGEVTVNLLATEPGTQRISATVAGVGTVYYTKYWVALDEVYLLCADEDEDYEYNAGTTTKALEARAVVFGPGPLSTSAQDWYNAYQPNATGALAAVDWPIGFVLAQINQFYRTMIPVPGAELTVADLDKIIEWALDWADAHEDLILGLYHDPSLENILGLVNLILAIDRWTCDVEALAAAHGYTARGIDGVSMYWSIVNVVEDDPATKTKNETVPSVGDIVKVDGNAITAAKTAVGTTDATGKSSIELSSQVTGQTKVQVVADYAGNPYPGQLFNHLTHQVGLHFLDWDDQPYAAATAVYTWIPHVIGGDEEGPISAAKLVNNTGEVEEFVLNLKDVYGNAIDGYTVAWWIEGVGFFKTDDSSWTGIGETNKDFDITDVTGKASVWVKSLVPGQTVVHCKVMDKYGSTYKEWNLTKQWYSIDEVAFIDDTVWTDLDDDGKVDELFELGPSVNMVGTGHTFTVQVSGAKYVHILWDVNYNGLLDDVALLGKRADLKAAEGYVAVMSANQLVWVEKDAGDDVLPGQAFTTSLLNDRPDEVIYTRFADTALSGAEYWADKLGEDLDGNPMALDYISEVWSGLKGKNVYFYTNIGTCAGGILSNTPLPTAATGDLPNFVGVITDPTANPVLTDDMGKATVSIDSEDKGYQYVWAIADYLDNPQDGDPLRPWDAIDATDPAAPVNLFPDDGVMELRYDCTMKVWVADPTCSTDVRIYAQGAQQSDLRWANPVMDDPALNVDRIYVQVFDKFGNALEGYKVTFEIVGQGTTTDGTCDTYHPFAHFAYLNDDETTNETYETPNHDWYEVVPGPYPTVVEYLALDLDDPANMAAYMASNDIMHKAGVGDLNPFMNANWYWGLYGDAARADLSITPIPYASLPASMTAADKFGLDDKYDDDYAWGWTLDHEINFNFNAASAAYADLVLDETVGQIAAQLADPAVCHVTSIVNIKVYCPNGTLDKQFEITKIWSVDAPRLASLTLLVGPSATGPWSTAYGPTSVQPAYYMVLGYDQYGDPFSTTTNLCVRAASTGYSSLTDTGLTLTDGVYIGPLSASDLGTGVWNLLAFDDLDANNAPNLGETQSNLCTYTIQ